MNDTLIYLEILSDCLRDSPQSTNQPRWQGLISEDEHHLYYKYLRVKNSTHFIDFNVLNKILYYAPES